MTSSDTLYFLNNLTENGSAHYISPTQIQWIPHWEDEERTVCGRWVITITPAFYGFSALIQDREGSNNPYAKVYAGILYQENIPRLCDKVLQDLAKIETLYYVILTFTDTKGCVHLLTVPETEEKTYVKLGAQSYSPVRKLSSLSKAWEMTNNLAIKYREVLCHTFPDIDKTIFDP